jgi:hypothetical protein
MGKPSVKAPLFTHHGLYGVCVRHSICLRKRLSGRVADKAAAENASRAWESEWNHDLIREQLDLPSVHRRGNLVHKYRSPKR